MFQNPFRSLLRSSSEHWQVRGRSVRKKEKKTIQLQETTAPPSPRGRYSRWGIHQSHVHCRTLTRNSSVHRSQIVARIQYNNTGSELWTLGSSRSRGCAKKGGGLCMCDRLTRSNGHGRRVRSLATYCCTSRQPLTASQSSSASQTLTYTGGWAPGAKTHIANCSRPS